MLEQFKLKYRELEAKKRTELEAALDRREVHDPISLIVGAISIKAILASAAISVAVSAASYALSRAFAPKPPKQILGKLQGTLQLQNSEQGIMIPEIYGAGPAASAVAGASPTWQNLTNVTGGANGSLTKTSGADFFNNAGASHNVAVNGDAFIRVICMAGFAGAGFFNTASPTGSGSTYTGLVFGIAWNDLGTSGVVINGVLHVFGSTSAGDTLTIELRNGRFHLYRNAAEITDYGNPVPVPSFPLYLGAVIHNIGAGVSDTKVQIGGIGDPPNFAQGGIKVPAIIDYSSGIRKHVNVTTQQVGGKGFMGGQNQTTENITYDIDLGLTFAGHGPYDFLRLWANADVLIDQTATSLLLTGVYNPTTGADPDYDPELPPDPTVDYILPIDRQNRTIPYDGFGVGTGSIQGGGSGFALYAGTSTQEPDPTEEADIDAKHGIGSTPAHRGKARAMLTNFGLSRWGGIVPNMTAALQHQTLTNLDLIYSSMCERVNVKAANGDYDWSGLATIKPRGMLIAGRLYAPAEVIGSPEIQTVYNYFVTETEGQLIGFIEGAEPSVTIADTEIGWMDSDADVSDVLPEVETIIASEIGLSRQVDVKYIDLDKEWEPNTQSDNRQITEGVSTEVMEVQLALLASEARAAAQRKLYRDYVAGSIHRFTLPWTYLYLYPGYKITITRAEGFSHVMKLTSISGGLGVLECEGVAIEPAAYTQPAVGSIQLGNPPPQSIPAMTVLSLLDTPLLRDGDETNNNGIGFYACGTPRTGINQTWLGFALYRSRNSVWSLIASSNLPATIGMIVSATGLNTVDPSVWDRTGVFVVDLYGTSASLSGVTEQDIEADATKNLAVFGNMVGHFATATQVPGFPNRWSLSILLNGRRGTEDHVTDTFTGLRFVLINAAVIFVPAMVTDIDGLFSYRAVTSGQSLGDAATVDFAYTGVGLEPLTPVSLVGTRDSLGNLLIQWTRRSRLGAGMIPGSDVPLGEETEDYAVDILTSGSVLKRTMFVTNGGGRPAVLIDTSQDHPDLISGNNILASGVATEEGQGYAYQQITSPGTWVEATLSVTPTNGFTAIYLSDPSWITNPALASANGAYRQRVSFSITTLPGIRVQNAAGTLLYNSGSLGSVQRVRIRGLISGTETRYYWDYTGPGSVPFYVSSVVPTFPLVAEVQCIGQSASIENVTIGDLPQPSIIYSAEQQVTDFGSVQNPIRVRVAQISSIVGRGGYVQGDL
jgi:hypothetical protein